MLSCTCHSEVGNADSTLKWKTLLCMLYDVRNIRFLKVKSGLTQRGTMRMRGLRGEDGWIPTMMTKMMRR